MIKDAFSIVIPAYKTDDLLRKLLNELFRQKEEFPQTQIVVVDDGSGMYWLDELDVKAIHRENGGEAAARNTGLKNAEGEYLAWVDSDDMVVSDYLRTIYAAARKGYDFEMYRWRCSNGVKGYQWKESRLWNHNVWSYTYKRKLITEWFDERRNYAPDFDWLVRQVRPEWSLLYVDKEIVIYNESRPDSLTNLYNRGEISLWK